MKSILVTGATGFVGRLLCSRLLSEGWNVRGTILATESPSALVASIEPVLIEPLGPDTPWGHALAGVDTVIHLAARVHIMDDPASDPLTEFRTVNGEGTAQLAREAAKAGVKRLVFISSIKVNGEETTTPYTTNSPPQASDPYGISKWEAELALRHIEAETGLEVVVVRPTLVYGPGVKANFFNMMKVVQRGIPLPLASVTNRRSLIYVGNLVDSLTTCAKHPAAAGKTYLVSDGEDISTPELIRRTARALGVPSRIFPFPLSLLNLAGAVTGKRAAINRLLGSLTVDSSSIRRELEWKPPFSMDEGLAETAAWFKATVSVKAVKAAESGTIMKRVFDFSMAFLLMLVFAPLMLFTALLVRLTSKGPILYWSDRVGKNNSIFKMPKFRTMRTDAPAVATHLLDDPDRYLTSIGRFLRKTSLDELPQLFSILRGDMSFVGPRPALFNQDDLIQLRTERGIHRLVPGLTGWAQVNGRDELPIPAKVDFDDYYLHRRSLLLDLKIILLTLFKVARSEGVKH